MRGKNNLCNSFISILEKAIINIFIADIPDLMVESCLPLLGHSKIYENNWKVFDDKIGCMKSTYFSLMILPETYMWTACCLFLIFFYKANNYCPYYSRIAWSLLGEWQSDHFQIMQRIGMIENALLSHQLWVSIWFSPNTGRWIWSL